MENIQNNETQSDYKNPYQQFKNKTFEDNESQIDTLSEQ